MTDSEGGKVVAGQIKWFDSGRGFGFIVDSAGGPDILLHANVLRNFGQSTVSEGARLSVLVTPTARGLQAAQVLEIEPPTADAPVAIPELAERSAEEITALPMLPARVKWFDKSKGFGFANLFGQPGDVFLHVEVLRHCGFSDLSPGEAVALRVIEGRRGLMAAEIIAWDRASATCDEGGHGASLGNLAHAAMEMDAIAGRRALAG